MPRSYRHDRTLGQLWGNVHPNQRTQVSGHGGTAEGARDGGRSESGAAGRGHGRPVRGTLAGGAWAASQEDAGQGNGSSPNSSWIRRRSRIRGSVSPPTQRPTVFTDTPSWRAAASWVRPSRRSVGDIQSAKVAWRAGAAAARGGAGAGAAPAAGAWTAPAVVVTESLECRTSTSTCSGKMRNETWIAPVGPAASSRARKTVSPTSRLPCSVSGDSARQRRTKSRISGIQEGRAGKVWDSTTTGTTSIAPSPSFRSGTACLLAQPGQHHSCPRVPPRTRDTRRYPELAATWGSYY